MLPRLVLHVTPETLRVELTGTGVIWEEAAAIVPQYRARSGLQIVAAGDMARTVEAKGFDPIDPAKARDDADLFTRIVLREAAPWWREATTRASRGAFDPWDHNGECVVVWPFAPDTWVPALGAALLHYVRFTALQRAGAPRIDAFLRWWLMVSATVEVRLATPPPTEAARDAFVRQLASQKMRLAGGPASPDPLPLSELSWQQWASAALVAFGLPVLRFGVLGSKLGRHPLRVVLMFVGVCIAAGAGVITTSRSAGADHDMSRESLARKSAASKALCRFEVTRADGDEASPSSPRRFQLGPQGVLQFVPMIFAVGLAWLGGHAGAALAAVVGAGLQRFVNVGFVVLFCVGLALGEALVGARLAVGARGITVRLAGVASRPLFIPIDHVRSAVAVGAQPSSRWAGVLSILLRDGDELRVSPGTVTTFWRRGKVALAAEEAILAAIGAPRPCRTPATGP